MFGLREVEILSTLRRLDHPNIVKLHDWADEDNLYIVMEYCKGGDLLERIMNSHTTITEKRASQWVKTTLITIKYLHDIDIVHRDIKPDNFVFQNNKDDAELILVDFGSALQLGDDQRVQGTQGTDLYCSPEVAHENHYIRTGRVWKAAD